MKLIAHKSNYGEKRDIHSIRYIVIHYTGATGQTASNNLRYFNSNANLKSSAHYFIGEDGVGQSVEEEYVAWHCGTSGKYNHPSCRNSNSIGIEVCFQYKNSKWVISESVYNSLIELVKSLQKNYNIPTSNVLRHFDITGKNCPLPWVTGNQWDLFKKDLEVDKMENKIYNSKEEIPLYFKNDIEDYINKNCFGDVDNLDLDYQQLRILVILKRYIEHTIGMTK